jgi:hypothetical protein
VANGAIIRRRKEAILAQWAWEKGQVGSGFCEVHPSIMPRALWERLANYITPKLEIIA